MARFLPEKKLVSFVELFDQRCRALSTASEPSFPPKYYQVRRMPRRTVSRPLLLPTSPGPALLAPRAPDLRLLAMEDSHRPGRGRGARTHLPGSAGTSPNAAGVAPHNPSPVGLPHQVREGRPGRTPPLRAEGTGRAGPLRSHSPRLPLAAVAAARATPPQATNAVPSPPRAAASSEGDSRRAGAEAGPSSSSSSPPEETRRGGGGFPYRAAGHG